MRNSTKKYKICKVAQKNKVCKIVQKNIKEVYKL